MPGVAIPSLSVVAGEEEQRRRERELAGLPQVSPPGAPVVPTGFEPNDPELLAFQAAQGRERQEATHQPAPPATPIPEKEKLASPALDMPRPPSPSPGATMTTRAGPVSVQTPIAPGADLSQSTSRGGKTTSQRQVSAEEVEHQKKIADLEKKSLEEAELIDRERAAKANSEAVVAAARDADTQWQLNQHEAEIQKRQAAADAADQEYRRDYKEWRRDPKKRFWANKDTGDTLSAGVSLLLGLVGGLSDGSNVGAERIEKAIDAEETKYRQIVDDSLAILNRSKGDVEKAKASWNQKKELIDVKYASILGSIVADADARARRLGISEEEMLKNPGRQKLLEAQAARQQKWFESTSANVQNEQAWSRMNAGTGTGANGKPLPAEAAERISVINSGVDAITRMQNIIAKNPKAWEEYRANQESWQRSEAFGAAPGLKQGRGILQGVGLANVAPEQGLKSQDAIELHRLQTELNGAMAKARGGAITDSDVKAIDSMQATLATNAGAKEKQLQRITQVLNNAKATHLSGRVDPSLAPSAAPQAPAPAQAAPVSRFKDRTGRVFMGRRLPDGSIEEVQ